MHKIENMVVFGGTHGNEMTGVEVLKLLEKRNYFGKNLNLYAHFANRKAYELGKRFVDKDLNRSFTKDVLEKGGYLHEERIAKEIYDKFSGDNNLIIDLHTSTANMGKSIVLTKLNNFNLKLISFLQNLHDDLNVFYWEENEELAFLNTISPFGFAIEMGPVANNVLDCKIIEDTLVLVEDILDFAEKYNKNMLPNLKEEILLFEGKEYLYYPMDENGERFGYIHDEFQGKDFMPLCKGDRIFKTQIDTNIEYKGDEGYCALFINEAAYYSKNIACCLAKKINVKIK
ncbi:MAG: aspartoacylase [Fusobacteriaceae bacterium]|nr:aspartoacylase [Fusobacteriaceae bacterium]